MLIFAFIVLILSVSFFIYYARAITRDNFRDFLMCLVPLIFFILGSVWYIFPITFIPDSLMVSAALGASILNTITFCGIVKDKFFVWYSILSIVAMIFFALAVLLSVYPNLFVDPTQQWASTITDWVKSLF